MHNAIKFTVTVICLGLLSLSTLTHASTHLDNTDNQQTSRYKLVGEGTMRWLWFDIYQISLRTPSGLYQHQQWPLSLSLTYARAITRQQLIETTKKEWQRQGISYQDQWLSKLNDIWPNISPQDHLLLTVTHQGNSQFFYNQHFIGSLDDAQFSKAFTAIWLSDNTLKPALRNQLIGQ